MKSNIKLILFLSIITILFAVLLTKNYNLKNINSDYHSNINELKQQYKDNYELATNYKKEIDVLHNELENNKGMIIVNRNQIKEEFKWMGHENWKKVIISKNNESKEINSDSNLFINPFALMSISSETYMPINGFVFTDCNYIYKYISDNNEITIRVHDNNMFTIDGLDKRCFLFEGDKIRKYGDAFLSNEIFNSAGNIYTKIANSSLITSDNICNWDSWRLKLIASDISNMQVINLKNNNYFDDDVKEKEKINYNLYYYGDIINLNTYDEYLQIIDGNNEYWFKSNDDENSAEFIIGHILGIG